MGKLATSGNSRTRSRLAHIGGSSTPTSPVAGSWAWFDASDTATITGGATVTQWNDKSGNARNQTPGVAGSPSSGTRTHNGLNVIDFDGINDGLGRVAALGFGTSTFTVFFVGGQDDNVSNAGLVTIHNGAAHDYNNSDAFVFGTANHAGSKVIGIDMNNAALTLAGGTGATPTAVWTLRKNGSAVAIFKNGVSVATGTIFATGTANAAMSICWRSLEAGNYLNGFAAEVIIYATALSDGDVALNYSYLGTKWAL